MNHELDIYIELYKRGSYENIPLGKYPDGEYFYPTKKQVETLQLLNNQETSFIGYGGSARSGKSLIECTAIIFDCLSYDGIAWGLGRKELTTLKRTVLLTLFKQFEFYGIKEKDFNYNQQLNRVDFNNGSTVFLIDTAYKPSDPLNTRFGGFELTRCAVDESNETNEDVLIKLYERTGWRKNDVYGLKRKMFECFNPAKNHVYRRYYKPFKDKVQTMFSRFIAALPSDNPHPSVKEWIDDILKTGDKVTIERQVKGNFEYDDDPSALIDTDAISDYFSPNHLTREGEMYLTMDIARKGKDNTVFRVWHGWVCIHREHIDKSGLVEVVDRAKALQKRFAIPLSNTIADEDGVGGGVVDFLQCKGFVNNSRALNNENFNNLKSQCGYKMAKKIVDRECGELASDSSVVGITTEEMEQVKQKDIDKDGKVALVSKDVVKMNIGRSPDEWDSIMMRYWFELAPRFEVA